MGRALIMTYQIAMAISFDAAERRCRKAGRKAWVSGDYACAVKAFQKCVPLMEPVERAR